MLRIITVSSGKGGVGKTTVATNLSIGLRKLGKKVVIIDCNLTTSHIGLAFGIEKYSTTLNDFLKGTKPLNNILYRHGSGLEIVPASINLEDLIDVNIGNFRNSLKETFSEYDFVILDSAPGLGNEALISLRAADEVIFVTTPHIPDIVDILKTKDLLSKIGGDHTISGILINRIKYKDYEIKSNQIREFTGIPIIGLVPEDGNVSESINKGRILLSYNASSPAALSFHRLASRLAGIPYSDLDSSDLVERNNFFSSLKNSIKNKFGKIF